MSKDTCQTSPTLLYFQAPNFISYGLYTLLPSVTLSDSSTGRLFSSNE